MNVEQFWEAVILQKAEALRSFFHPKAVIRWHCTDEQFTVEEYLRANCEYPGQWQGEIERVVPLHDQVIIAGHVHNHEATISCHVVSFATLREGKIMILDEYWGDDGPAPQWRQTMGLGRKIT